jgi:tripartite-type tricarboxylate transporter receptor subunit TctC
MAMFAPAGVAKPVVEQIHAAIVRAAQTSAAQQFYRTYTMTFVGDTPSAFADFVKRDQATASAAFRRMGLKPGDH